MMQKMIGNYKIIEAVSSTENACLYKAVEWVAEEAEQIPYILKKLTVRGTGGITLRKEKEITQYIENNVQESIIIPVLKIIQAEDGEYAVMQFYRHGMVLTELIQALEKKYGPGEVPLGIQIELLLQILQSLKILHHCVPGHLGRGYLHMDLHPGNIFLENCNPDKGVLGSAKFLDFQNALKMNQEGVAIRETSVLGITPGFYAPEQLSAFQSCYSEAVDLYAVAAVGARIFTGKTVTDIFQAYDLLLEQMETELQGKSLISYFMWKFLRRGLERNAYYRFQTADSMMASLLQVKGCLKNLQMNQYYQLYSAAYGMLVPQNRIRAAGMWYQEGAFRKSVESLKQDLNEQDNDTSRVYYIFQGLWKLKQAFGGQIPRSDLYQLISCGIESCNYLGDSKRALELFEELEQIKEDIPLIAYLELINYVAECYVDTYRYEEAYALILRNVESLDRLKAVYVELAGQRGLHLERSTTLIERGKAYSACGRYMAFLHTGDPEAVLLEAAEEFSRDEGNWYVTISHILHYSVEAGNEALFRKYAGVYLGDFRGKTAAGDCLELLKEQLGKAPPWRLWILFKGIYRFYLPMLIASGDRKFFSLLREIIYNGDLNQCMAYPVELIYRYIGLLLFEENNRQMDDTIYRAFELAVSCPESEQIQLERPLTIRMLVKYHTLWIYNSLTDRVTDNQDLYQLLKRHSQMWGWEALSRTLEKEASLEGILGYEHC